MTIVYTLHAAEKLLEKEPKRLGITKRAIENVVIGADMIDRSNEPVRIAMGKLDGRHSLCVVYRQDEGVTRIITFFPARKGRYEAKVLS